jgi:preprotein translocase subunit SecF
LTVLALYFYGGESLKGMAESQIIGIVIGTLSSIFVACPLLLLMGVTKQDLMPKARDEEALNARP